jgi:hypothetical protein
MTRRHITIGFVALAMTFGVGATYAKAKATQLVGSTGFSTNDGSGWLDITSTDFSAGEHLVISVGGTASAVTVRLLPKGFDPNKPDVTIAEKVLVRSDRTVDIALTSDFKNIVQVSIHGKARPFGLFDLGTSNGPATIKKVERIRP